MVSDASDTEQDFSEININEKSKETKLTDLPANAYALYIRLYCRKKKNLTNVKSKKDMIEATQSWLSLSQKDKQQFYDKYNECQRKHMQTISNCLQKAEPYMKEKSNARFKKTESHEQNVSGNTKIENGEGNHIPDEINEEQDNIVSLSESKVEGNNETIFNDEMDNLLNQTKVETDIEDYRSYSQEEHMHPYYPEPTPPNLKTGKELYEMISAIDNNENKPWDSLTHKEKYHHSKAVLTLKLDYIQKFKQYLENLSQRELFNYYNKTFN